MAVLQWFAPMVLLIAAVVIVLLLARPARSAPAGVVTVADRQLLVHWVAVVLGVAVAWWLSGWDALGRGLMLAVPAGALVVLVCVAAAQLLVRPPRGALRSAPAQPRRIADYWPVGLGGAVVGLLGWLVVLLALTTLAGSADDLGRPGRSLNSSGISADGLSCTSGRGPWPGSFYSMPLALMLLIAVLAAAIALREIAVRPRLADDGSGADDLLRRRSARTVLAASGLVVAVPALGVEATAGHALVMSTQCAPSWWVPLGWAVLATALPTLVVLIWSAAALLVPGALRTAGPMPAQPSGEPR